MKDICDVFLKNLKTIFCGAPEAINITIRCSHKKLAPWHEIIFWWTDTEFYQFMKESGGYVDYRKQLSLNLFEFCYMTLQRDFV